MRRDKDARLGPLGSRGHAAASVSAFLVMGLLVAATVSRASPAAERAAPTGPASQTPARAFADGDLVAVRDVRVAGRLRRQVFIGEPDGHHMRRVSDGAHWD